MGFCWKRFGRRALITALLAALTLGVGVAGYSETQNEVNIALTTVNDVPYPQIEVRARVTDGEGNVISGLTEDDFVLTEQSELETTPVEQRINVDSVGAVTDSVSLALAIDRSGSMGGTPMAKAREAAKDMVGLLGPEDMAAVLSFASSVSVDQELTGDKQALKDAISVLSAGGMTAFYRAIEDSINLIDGKPGVPAVLAFTDGRNNRSPNSPDGAIALAQEKGIPVYTIGLGNVDHGVLENIAAETRATYYYTPRPEDLADLYEEIARDLEEQYVIGYSTHNVDPDDTERTIEVTVTVNGVSDSDTITYTARRAVPSPSLTGQTRQILLEQQAVGEDLTLEVEIASNMGGPAAKPLSQPLGEDDPNIQATLYYRISGSGTHYESMPMSANGDLFSATIPGDEVESPGLDFYISVTDGISTITTPRHRPAREPHQAAVYPNKKPVISHSPVEAATSGRDINVTADVDDADPYGPLDEVAVHYRPSDEVFYTKLPMSAGGTSYTATIPGSDVGTAGVEYYITATDEHGVRGYHGTWEEPHTVRVDAGRAYSASLEAGWNLVSVPAVPINDAPEAVFADVVDLGQTLYLYEWDPAAEEYVMPEAINPGRGYWLYLFDPVTVEMRGEVPAGTYRVALDDAGWHKVSSLEGARALPGLRIERGEESRTLAEAIGSGWVSPDIWGYDPETRDYGEPVPGDGGLNPWSGYWLYTQEDDLTLVLPLHQPPPPPGVVQALKAHTGVGERTPPPPPPTPEAEGAALEVRAFPNPLTQDGSMVFRATGVPVERLRVAVYDLSGQLVFWGEDDGNTLGWDATNPRGRPVANGVYLYSVQAEVDGEWLSAPAERLLILR